MIYRDQFVVNAPLAKVAAFIGDAQRIIDYYPAALHGQNLVLGQLLACYGKGTACLLVLDNTQSRPDFLVFKVYCCVTFSRSLRPKQFRHKALFCMTESWSLQPLAANQTAVTKTWQHLKVCRFRLLPKALFAVVVRFSAKRERDRLLAACNKAAAAAV